MVNRIPGRIVKLERTKEYVLLMIENLGNHTVTIRITDLDEDALWAAGEYWNALMEHGNELLMNLEDELREMGVWEDTE